MSRESGENTFRKIKRLGRTRFWASRAGQRNQKKGEAHRAPRHPAGFHTHHSLILLPAYDPLTSSSLAGASTEHPKLTVSATFARSSVVICTK